MVKVPSRERLKPCRTLFASRLNPMIVPDPLMSKVVVPWKGPVPAPGASIVVTVCAHIGVVTARAIRMITDGTNCSFRFEKYNGFILVKRQQAGKRLILSQ